LCREDKKRAYALFFFNILLNRFKIKNNIYNEVDMNKELSDLKKFLKSAGFSSEYNYLLKISEDIGQLAMKLQEEGYGSQEKIKRLEYLIDTDDRIADAFSQAADKVLELVSDFIMKEIKENMRSLYSYVSSKTASLNVGIRKYALMDILKKYSGEDEASDEKFDYAPIVSFTASFYRSYLAYYIHILASAWGIFTSEGKIAKAKNVAKFLVMIGFPALFMEAGDSSALITALTGGVLELELKNILVSSGMALISKAITEGKYYEASKIEESKKRFDYVNNMWENIFKGKEEIKWISEGLGSREGLLARVKNTLEESWSWLKDNTKSKDGTPLLDNIDPGKYLRRILKMKDQTVELSDDSEKKNNVDSSVFKQTFDTYLGMWDGINKYLKDTSPLIPRNYIAQVLVILKEKDWDVVEAAKEPDFWENIIDALMMIIITTKIIDIAGESYSIIGYLKNIEKTSGDKILVDRFVEVVDNLVSAILADLVEAADYLFEDADLSNPRGFGDFSKKILELENNINLESYEEWDKLKNMTEQYLD
jgi:hypothetical protein